MTSILDICAAVLYDNIFTWMCGTTPTKGIVTQGSKGGYQQNKGADFDSFFFRFAPCPVLQIAAMTSILDICAASAPLFFTWMCGTTPTKGIVTQGSKGGYQQNKGAEAAQMSNIVI
jgi:hypothetical protein